VGGRLFHVGRGMRPRWRDYRFLNRKPLIASALGVLVPWPVYPLGLAVSSVHHRPARPRAVAVVRRREAVLGSPAPVVAAVAADPSAE
jgi:hypothetical protein